MSALIMTPARQATCLVDSSPQHLNPKLCVVSSDYNLDRSSSRFLEEISVLLLLVRLFVELVLDSLILGKLASSMIL